MTKLDNVLKRKDIALLTGVHLVRALVFLVIMYRCEGWAIKKAVKVKVTQSCLTLCNPMDYTFSGAGYWIG